MRIFSRKNTFANIIISYLIVLVIPLIFGVSFFVTTLGITRRSVDEANLSVLDNMRDNVNINLSGISNMMRALLNDNAITSLSNKAGYTPQDYNMMDRLQNILSISLVSNAYIDDILIYFHKSDFVLSSKSYLHYIGDMTGYSSTVGLDIADFIEQVSITGNYTLRLVDSNTGPAAFITALGTSRTGTNDVVTILVRLKSSLLADMMVSDDCSTFLVDASDNTLPAQKGAWVRKENGAWTLEGDSGGSQRIETEDHMFQICYVRFVPSRIYFQNFSTVCLLFVAFLVLCLGCGLPLAVSTARRSYHPIQEILSLVPQPHGTQDVDDYRVIRSSLTALLQKTEDYKVERDNRAITLRSYLLYRLLNGADMKESTFLAECRKCEVPFENTCFLLMGFSIENGSNLFFEQNDSVNEDISHFLSVAITSVLRDVFTEDYSFFTAEFKDAWYVVVNVNARLDREVVVDEIKKSCLMAAGRLDADFRVIVSIAVSNVHTGYQKIRRCYAEVEEIARQQECQKHSAYVTHYNELARLKQEADMQAPGRLAPSVSRTKKESKKGVNVQEISAYIDEHYSEPDLTVGALSERFHMTAANLSLLFKRRLGLPPLEYIQLKRVSEAKSLLDTTQMKVSDIAKSVGYYDSRPLIRAFRRIEGVSPAEYQEQKRPG
ncbi:helix-turn-helix domain-containing protein [Acutalibacter sp.]|uniref:helix-turn-helix domain-containing protein n=1 Tax=Acutalibacter sp. TaxID=1918636 RepID=UPI00216E5BBF|nr:helix-turn-helix transcriptional regulator [Acutalibacter sp.]